MSKKMSKKLMLAVIATSVTIPAFVAPVHYDASYDKPFSDVSSKNTYYDIIHKMRDQGIISGYEDGTFKPSETLSRKHAAALINRAVDLPKTTTFVKPNDLSEDNPYYADLKALIEAGLLQANSKGNINLNAPLTRGDMAKILATAFNLEVKADFIFSDVVGTGYEKYVKALYSNGVTTGYEDHTFKVSGSLTRAHYAVFMYRAMNLNNDYVAEPIPPSKNDSDKGTSNKPDKDTAPNGSNNGKPTDSTDKPIEKPKDQLIESGNIKKPNGYSSADQELEQIKIRVKEKHNRVVTFSAEGSRTEFFLTSQSDLIGISRTEFVDVINGAIKTGEVYDGGNYSLYYNYDTNVVHLSRLRE